MVTKKFVVIVYVRVFETTKVTVAVYVPALRVSCVCQFIVKILVFELVVTNPLFGLPLI